VWWIAWSKRRVFRVFVVFDLTAGIRPLARMVPFFGPANEEHVPFWRLVKYPGGTDHSSVTLFERL